MTRPDAMEVRGARADDFAAWLALAREVEPLFGPMADEPGFCQALEQAISDRTAFCLGPDAGDEGGVLPGGVVIAPQANEIAWLAVARAHRGQGLGRRLLSMAMGKLNPAEDILVQTFDQSVPLGKPARALYLDMGFVDHADGGLNPAGVPTVIMRRAARQPNQA